MASNGFNRQSSFVNGDVADADDLNNEFNQLAQAFHEVDGHTHDGTEGQGSPVPFIKDAVSGTKVTTAAGVVTVDIDGNLNVFQLSAGELGEALLNGIDVATFSVDGHTHTKGDITDFAHTHNIGDVINLQAVLDSKFSVSNPPSFSDLNNPQHTHVIAEVTGLQAALDSKYSTTNPVNWNDIEGKPTVPSEVHTHVIGDIDGLQAALDNKTDIGHTHTEYEPVFNKNTGFNKNFGTTAGTVAEGNHGHTKAQVGLSNVDNTSDLDKPISNAVATELTDNYARRTHTHVVADVTGLQALLDAKLTGTFNFLNASATLFRTARRSVYMVDTTNAVTITLDETTFDVGDEILIFVANDLHGGITLTTALGTIKVEDNTQSAATHTLTDSAGRLHLVKGTGNNWYLAVY